MKNYEDLISTIFEKALSENASDIHFSTGKPPIVRVDGKLIPLKDEKILGPDDTKELTFFILGEERKKEFLAEKELDFSYEYKYKTRFRGNAYFQQSLVSCSLRIIPSKIKTIEELNLPSFLHRFTDLKQGFVLVTGPASHGKSTTLAAIIDEINRTRESHIITIEDPIEYVFYQQKSIIDQREVGLDTTDFKVALRSTLRQDPDVIMLGEMRDYESISIALTAAETGHLVLSTLHTNSASQTIDRIIDVFPADQQRQVRVQLSASLAGIVSQRLLPRTTGEGRVPACEIMVANPAVSNIIREGRTHELDMMITTSSDEGMISLNRSLANLVIQKEISFEDALKFSLSPSELKLLLNK
jgi:twitching motility protein PilT